LKEGAELYVHSYFKKEKRMEKYAGVITLY